MRIGRLEISGSFLLLAAWLNYLDRQQIVPMALLACALHELGHYWTARALGVRVSRLRLTAAGAEMAVDGTMPYGVEMVVVLAGPGVNLLLALLFCRLPGGQLFAGLNLVLAWFNLIPIRTLDGGRFLRGLLSVWTSLETADCVIRWLNRIFIGLFLCFGLFFACFGGSATLLITSCWLLSSDLRGKSGKKACHLCRKRVK